MHLISDLLKITDPEISEADSAGDRFVTVLVAVSVPVTILDVPQTDDWEKDDANGIALALERLAALPLEVTLGEVPLDFTAGVPLFQS